MSVRVFVRGLGNLKTQLKKAQDHAAATGANEAALLGARLAADGAAGHPRDLHRYTLAAQAHWAAEGARLAIAQLLGAPTSPAANDEKSFAQLHERIDATLSYLQEAVPADLEAGLDRTIVIEHPRGSMSSGGAQFLLAYAIPHFHYHLTAVYGILRNQGVPLTMADFLGDWPHS